MKGKEEEEAGASCCGSCCCCCGGGGGAADGAHPRAGWGGIEPPGGCGGMGGTAAQQGGCASLTAAGGVERRCQALRQRGAAGRGAEKSMGKQRGAKRRGGGADRRQCKDCEPQIGGERAGREGPRWVLRPSERRWAKFEKGTTGGNRARHQSLSPHPLRLLLVGCVNMEVEGGGPWSGNAEQGEKEGVETVHRGLGPAECASNSKRQLAEEYSPNLPPVLERPRVLRGEPVEEERDVLLLPSGHCDRIA